MSESRIQNTKRNIASGVFKQIISILLPFITRTVFLQTLGAQYLGLNSLFTSILHVLNLADLGFSSAVVYALYKPIAEHDNEAVCAIIAYLRKVYRIVGAVILAAGLIVMPLLPSLINGDYPAGLNIYVLYGFYLVNTVLSYWLFAYKSVLLTAMQRTDIIDNIYTLTFTGLKLAQIAVVFFIRDYYLYVAVLLLFTVTNNLLIAYVSGKHYPQFKPSGQISPETRQDLVKQVKGIVIGKIGDMARNGCDSIFLSVLLGLTVVAIYDNYYYIYNAVYGVSLTITGAIQASVGNSVAKESIQKNYDDLCKFSFIFTWFTGWCTVCLCCLYQPFMLIWMKGDFSMLLSNANMLLFALYFYAITMNNMRNMYVNGAGLYWELRVWFVAEAIGNILLNLILGYFFGVTGIIAATIITIFICNFITRTNVLFRCYFRQSPRQFYLHHLIWFAATAVNCALVYWLCSLIHTSGIAGLALKALVCLIVPNIVYFLLYRKTKLYETSIGFIRNVLKLH